MKKVLITGITGFVGTNLLPFLEKAGGTEVYGVVRNPDTVNGLKQKVQSVWAVSDLPAIDPGKFDIIVHLAGKAHDLRKVVDEQEYFTVNYELTKSLYDWFLNSSASKFIYVSSVKAVADSVKDILKEEAVPAPLTAYGKSKLKAEEYIIEHKKEGKQFYILRPCMIHGPHNKGNLNLLFSLINKGIPYPLGAFENKRSFLSIDNLSFIINEIMHGDIPSGTYNVADDETLSTKELIEMMGKVLHKKARIMNISSSLIKGFCNIGDKLHLPLNNERLNKLTENFIVSNSKIKSVLNKSLPLTAKEGLIKTFESFRS